MLKLFNIRTVKSAGQYWEEDYWSTSHHLALVDIERFKEGQLRREQTLQGDIVLSQALHQ